jgi:iron complex outermembrane recepter protein
VRAAFDLPAGRLSWVSSRAWWELGPYASVLAFGPAELLNTSELLQETYTQELRFVSGSASRLRWQGGVLFSEGDTDGTFARAFGPVVIERSAYAIGARTGAVFAETEWSPGPRLEIVAGLRAEGSRKTFARLETAPTTQRFSDRRESSALLPKLSGRYAANERTAYFGSLSAGHKPGGFSAFTGRRDLAAFGPERVRAAEAGVRHRDIQRRLEATVRGYLYRISGYQIERSFATPGPGDDYLVVNAPRAASVGGEIEVRWRPRDGVELGFDAGVTRVTLRDFRDPYTGERFDGRRAPYVPSYDVAAVAEYRSRRGLFLGATLARTGSIPFTESGDARFVQGAVTLLEARAGIDRGPYRMVVSAANLTDERYYQSISAGTGHGTPGAPRSIGVEISREW